MNERERVLIIKTGYSEILAELTNTRVVSLGDILRTTVLLHAYSDRNKYDVTFVTDEKALPLLEHNPFVSRLMILDWITMEQLKKERFDILINLEKVPGICSLSDSISSRIKYGFTFNPHTREAEPYDLATKALLISTSPKFKKQNKRFLQEILYEMIGRVWRGEEYILADQPPNEVRWDVGLNTIAGQKWPTKEWPVANWVRLEEMLEKTGLRVDRQDSDENIRKGILNNLRYYIRWVNSCNTIVTIDSLGLHLSLALKKNTLGLFGPTPSNEVHFYSRGKAILPVSNCHATPCFNDVCEREQTCMSDISVERVYEAVMEFVGNSAA